MPLEITTIRNKDGIHFTFTTPSETQDAPDATTTLTFPTPHFVDQTREIDPDFNRALSDITEKNFLESKLMGNTYLEHKIIDVLYGYAKAVSDQVHEQSRSLYPETTEVKLKQAHRIAQLILTGGRKGSLLDLSLQGNRARLTKAMRESLSLLQKQTSKRSYAHQFSGTLFSYLGYQERLNAILEQLIGVVSANITTLDTSTINEPGHLCVNQKVLCQ